VLTSDSKYFTPAALAMLKTVRCEAPSQSQENAGRRYTMDFQFLYFGTEKLPKSEGAGQTVLVRASVLPGSHTQRAHGD
jgi:hypothetical protein